MDQMPKAKTDAAPQFDRLQGRPTVLGAETDGNGTNFALFSDHATAVELCLFDETGTVETHRLPLPDYEGGIWYGYLPGITEGQVYGYRVHGPYEPENGHRFNPAKLLLDPYARELRGGLNWDDAVFGYPIGGDDCDIDERDSAPFVPKAVVVDANFDWEADRALSHRWEDTFIYEAHVKGLTKLHPDVPEADRGTFAGLGSDAVIAHLQRLGVTAIELLPVHFFAQDRHLTDNGLSNYWGYNTLAFFAPHAPYLKAGRQIEMKNAIKRLHKAGIEVILDVVYNHTAEGNEMGPTLSFRGIDNASYYLLSPENPRHSFDTTGTGNTLNIAHPMVLRMVLDSLRYWVQVMHVDGFRFDLASTLGRESSGFERDGAFMNAIRQDPILGTVKLIAEPWDIGEGGYQVGGFPWPFREWNDKARDDIRAFWRRDPNLTGRLAQRVAGSPTQFYHSRRPATSSINFVAAHDGFTLWDTVSYNEKHNDANGEGNRDGHDNNLSYNMGVEGPTEDQAICAARTRRVKAMLGTMMLSQGVPMLLGGDELARTQQGNNNSYCQDNEISWLDWSAPREDLIDAVGTLNRIRREIGLPNSRFDHGPNDTDELNGTLRWFHPAGREMTEDDWNDGGLSVLAFVVTRDDRQPYLICMNGGDDGQFALPDGKWTCRIDTSRDDIACNHTAEGSIDIPGQSVMLYVATESN
jgi:glycogen operon protein